MNIATMTMEKMSKMLSAIDQKYKEFATEPYGIRKLTEREQWEQYKTLTPDKLIQLIQTEGLEKTNKWLYRMEQKEQHGR